MESNTTLTIFVAFLNTAPVDDPCRMSMWVLPGEGVQLGRRSMRIGGGLLEAAAPAAAVPTPPVLLGMATRPAESRPALEAIDIMGSWIGKLSKQSSSLQYTKHLNTYSSYVGTFIYYWNFY